MAGMTLYRGCHFHLQHDGINGGGGLRDSGIYDEASPLPSLSSPSIALESDVTAMGSSRTRNVPSTHITSFESLACAPSQRPSPPAVSRYSHGAIRQTSPFAC